MNGEQRDDRPDPPDGQHDGDLLDGVGQLDTDDLTGTDLGAQQHRREPIDLGVQLGQVTRPGTPSTYSDLSTGSTTAS